MTKRFGFTLAEVLITLGIIGVVAAMTIPTLITNYNQRAWDTGAAVFDRKLEEALKTMNTQSTLAGHTTTESFVEELSKHFKTNRICQNDNLMNCFSNEVTWGSDIVDMTKVDTAKDFGQYKWKTNIVGVQFANGVNAMIAYNPIDCTQDPYSNQITGSNCLAILYDTSGAKNPNTSGKDLRGTNIAKLGSIDCYKEHNGLCIISAAFKPTPVTKAECEQLVQDGYGIKGCAHSTDYWAGAVKQCEDMGGHLPDINQLAEIASYIYGTDVSTSNDVETMATADPEKAAEMGLNLSSYSLLWAKEEYTGQYEGDTFAVHSFGYGRRFYSNRTCYGYYNCGGYSNGRSLSSGQALCVTEN